MKLSESMLLSRRLSSSTFVKMAKSFSECLGSSITDVVGVEEETVKIVKIGKRW